MAAISASGNQLLHVNREVENFLPNFTMFNLGKHKRTAVYHYEFGRPGRRTLLLAHLFELHQRRFVVSLPVS